MPLPLGCLSGPQNILLLYVCVPSQNPSHISALCHRDSTTAHTTQYTTALHHTYNTHIHFFFAALFCTHYSPRSPILCFSYENVKQSNASCKTFKKICYNRWTTGYVLCVVCCVSVVCAWYHILIILFIGAASCVLFSYCGRWPCAVEQANINFCASPAFFSVAKAGAQHPLNQMDYLLFSYHHCLEQPHCNEKIK